MCCIREKLIDWYMHGWDNLTHERYALAVAQVMLPVADKHDEHGILYE